MGKVVPLRYRWEAAVRADTRLTDGQARAAWGLLAFWNRKTDTAYPSAATLAKASGLQEGTAQKAVAELVRLGYLVKIRKRGFRGSLEVGFRIPKEQPEAAANPASPCDIEKAPIPHDGAAQSRITMRGNHITEPLKKGAGDERKDSVGESGISRRDARNAILARYLEDEISENQFRAELEKIDQATTISEAA